MGRLSSLVSFFTARYAPAFITLLVLAGIFFFYFNVIVSRNETSLKERNFRGLHRMADNISKKIDNYVEENSLNFFKALNADSGRHLSFIENAYSLKNGIIDTSANQITSFSVKFIDGWKLFFKDTASLKNKVRLACTSIEKFTAPLLRRDLYPHYLLAMDDMILWDELNNSHQSIAAYLPGNSGIDSIKTGPLIQTSQVRNVEIGGKEFKLFLLPFIVRGSHKFLLGGYMSLEDYRSEQRYIPTYAILWLVIGIILVILMFPLLKVFLMHRSEQLLARNAISSLASIHILGSMVVLITMNIYVYFTMGRGKAYDNLRELARKIDTTFRNEIDTAFLQMDAAERQMSRKAIPTTDSILYKPEIYPYLQHIAWTDSAGNQRIKWTTNEFKSERIDISDRDYFLAVKKRRLWRWNDSKEFYLTEVSSRVENKNLAIISRPVSRLYGLPGDSLMMISLSGPFRSMFSPVLPDGFGFCVIKETGDVLFHLDENRNLNENLLEECNNNTDLQSLLHTKSAGYFGSRYSGSRQLFYVKPLAGMPYSIVTFRDILPLWSEDLDTISACSILTLMNLAIILLGILIIQATGYRHSLFEKQSILFTWLQPNSNLISAYRSVTIVYITAMILQTLFFFIYRGPDPLCQLGISFSYAFILIAYAYYQFAILSKKNDAGSQAENKKSFWFLTGIYIACSFIFLLYLITSGDGWELFLISQLLLLFIAYQVTWVKPLGNPGVKIKEYCSRRLAGLQRSLGIAGINTKKYRFWYILSVTSFIAATAIVPSVIFYSLSLKQEQVLSLKRTQLEFARQLLQKPQPVNVTVKKDFRLSYHTPFYYHNFADSMTILETIPPPADSSVSNFEVLYKKIKPSFSDYSRQLSFVKNSYAGGSDFNWSFLPGKNQLMFYNKVTKTGTYIDSSAGFAISSRVESGFDKTKGAIKKDELSFLLLIVALVLLLLGFLSLIKRVIKRVFFDGYDDTGYFEQFDDLFIPPYPVRENIFVTGLVNSGKSSAIKEYLIRLNLNFHEIDIAGLIQGDENIIMEKVSNLPDETKIVVIHHFEMAMDDQEATKKKLLLLEALFRKQNKQVIILSARSFESVFKNPGKDNTIDLCDRWSNIMNKFYLVYHHWKPRDDKDAIAFRKQVEDEMTKYSIDQVDSFWPGQSSNMSCVKVYLKEQIKNFFTRMDDECSHSDFLRGLQQPLLTYLNEHRDVCFGFYFQHRDKSHMLKSIKRHFHTLYEKICLKIQSLASNYYLSTWQSLSRDEQRTLYDIALDEMVNPANRDIATRLAGLALIKRLDNVAGYEVMSKSFRNFIFSQLDKKQVTSFKAEGDEKGSWSNFQLPILIVVIALSIFLFVTQKDSFTNLIAYIGAAAGGIGALLKLLGAIPSSK